MTIDERLERLAERHEALTQTVELMIAENREWDARIAAQNAQIAAQNAQIAAQGAQVAALRDETAALAAASEQKFEVIRQTFVTCLDSIRRLERIATAHETRIGRIESE
jgi:hypothetical protein